ncbi:hypothetical protein EW146_g7323 [Bondarzewia mesenterica]|uniref:Uncharacterized protein n=1 Tax=Bondarzewia mesenterica TaxID=1095465 RepID=A0A4S4LL83_9AGAM|nr:hypothetical protein EW146_g7323 [Bondarzewia mesenterica]
MAKVTTPRITNDIAPRLQDDDLAHLSNLPSPIKHGPIILAGNALQLQLDDSTTPTSFTYSNGPEHVLVSPYLSSPPDPLPPLTHDHEYEQCPTDPSASSPDSTPGPRPLARVRFRSRVRITSGLRHHRGARPQSVDSSGSGSPSSSISAPLRYRADEAAPRGLLSQRLSLLATSAWKKRRLAYSDSGGGGRGLLRVCERQVTRCRGGIPERAHTAGERQTGAGVRSGARGPCTGTYGV